MLYPTELRGLFGFDSLAHSADRRFLFLTTFGLGNRCSIRLSYGTAQRRI